MFSIQGFYVLASGAIQGHHGALVNLVQKQQNLRQVQIKSICKWQVMDAQKDYVFPE